MNDSIGEMRRQANNNFAVINFIWDRILGTYRRPDNG
jgi:sterol desaturase/sphingolipid hydroxylase (fatty acid hydroxylase superfamily)